MGTTMKIGALLLMTAAIASRPAQAASAGATQTEDALTLQKARELALSRSATLHSAELAVDAASLAARAQGYAALPDISASAGGSYGFNASQPSSIVSEPISGLSSSVKLAATQTIFDGGKIQSLVQKYGLATEAAREDMVAARLKLIGQADTAFFTVLEAEASVEAAAGSLDAARLRQTIARAKIDAGILSASAYLQTEADTAGYETSLVLAKKGLASARAALASLTGRTASAALAPADFSAYDGLLARLSALDAAGVEALAAKLSALAKANSPTLTGFAISSQESRLDVAIAKKAGLPTVSAGLSQAVAFQSANSLSSPAWAFPLSVSLSASMSLDLWTIKNNIDSASVAASQADLAASQGETDLELSLVQALYEWIASAGSIPSSAKALEYAKSNYDNVLEKFRLSSATTSDLSSAEALVSADQTALINARYSFLSDLSALRGLAGLEDEAQLVGLVP